ncbi:MAG: ferrous iron transport protein A [Sedimentisphaerales bacterium]|nr:ferrous iron transport protein A [Sedimentisphaerales bacterium]
MNDAVRLSQLEPGAKGRIVKIEAQSLIRRRLLEMGLVRGAEVTKVKLAPLADPAEYIVAGSHVSLRREEAWDVLVEPL